MADVQACGCGFESRRVQFSSFSESGEIATCEVCETCAAWRTWQRARKNMFCRMGSIFWITRGIRVEKLNVGHVA